MKKVLLSLVALILTFNTVNAEILEDNKVTVTTIDELQEAINNANDGDTIMYLVLLKSLRVLYLICILVVLIFH